MKRQVFKLSEYDFGIPKELIAQKPAFPRDACRLLVLDRKKKTIKQGVFSDMVDYFEEGDVLVLNDTKVIKARLIAHKETGAKIEVLLLKNLGLFRWEALVNPGRRAKTGALLTFENPKVKAKIVDKTVQGLSVLEFNLQDLDDFLQKTGKVPLPPYIKKETKRFGYYQTVFAKQKGAVAAPTAGLHFTKNLIKTLKNKGVNIVYITLHCGLATFRPIKVDDIRKHKIESEWIEISPQTAKMINSAKKQGKRVVAVGTTAIRTLESVAKRGDRTDWSAQAFCGLTDLYIVPGYKFKIVDSVITNFHTPASTNLILTCAFASLPFIRQGYRYAASKNFKFYSFGDAMLIV